MSTGDIGALLGHQIEVNCLSCEEQLPNYADVIFVNKN